MRARGGPPVLILVRHGRTAANAAGLLLGRRDPDLDEHGRAQADALAAVLGAPERLVSSPLTRTRRTAEVIGGDVELDQRWIEMDYGVLDGRPLAEVPASFWAAWRSDVDLAPEGGESHRQLASRVVAACEELAADAARREVVVVTHVSPIKAALAWALGVGPDVAWRTFVAPGSITRIATEGPTPVLRSFNERPCPS